MATDLKIEKSWKKMLHDEFVSEHWVALKDFIEKEYASREVYPAHESIFNAFELTPFESVKVVILGQDPYHSEGQAHGLSFSVPEGVKVPPSLQNIYKELYADLDLPIPNSGNLEYWAKQGVLLLNSTLTVRAREPGSHQKKGWEEFTDTVIKKINDEREHVVFILWGNYAKKKGEFIDRNKHLVLEAAHPSPLSAYNGFFGCKHFSQANTYLQKNKLSEINWTASE